LLPVSTILWTVSWSQAALKCVFLVTRTAWTRPERAAPDGSPYYAFAITFGSRWPAGETYLPKAGNTDLDTDPPGAPLAATRGMMTPLQAGEIALSK
jgi:hypothetical protein